MMKSAIGFGSGKLCGWWASPSLIITENSVRQIADKIFSTAVEYSQKGIEAAANVKHGTIFVAKSRKSAQDSQVDGGMSGRYRRLCRDESLPRYIPNSPPRLMPMKAGFLDRPCFSVRKSYRHPTLCPAYVGVAEM